MFLYSTGKKKWLLDVKRTRRTRNAYNRLLASLVASDGECVIYPQHPRSYAYFSVTPEEGGPAYVRATRFIWIMNRGAIPEKLMVCHTCDNPPCCNLEHFFLGTGKDNWLDSRSKARDAKSKGTAKGRPPWMPSPTKGMKFPNRPEMAVETRKKISATKTGQKMSEEARAKISATLKGRPSPTKGRVMPEEQRQRISQSTKGRKKSPETVQKMREAALRKYAEGRVPRPVGHLNSFYGKHHSDETKKTISAKRLARVGAEKEQT